MGNMDAAKAALNKDLTLLDIVAAQLLAVNRQGQARAILVPLVGVRMPRWSMKTRKMVMLAC